MSSCRLLGFARGGLVFSLVWVGCSSSDPGSTVSDCLVSADCPPGYLCSAGACLPSPTGGDLGPTVPGTDAGEDDDGSDMCPVAVTCEDVGAECGIIEDGCDGYIECGECEAPEICGGGGAPDVCGTPCSPSFRCGEPGLECGLADDGCGTMLDCGDPCLGEETCGGGGEPNKCGSSCTPTTCEALGATCGLHLDGCNGSVMCGGCPPGQVCSGGTCTASCTPVTCQDYGAHCGPLADGCGNLLDCGPCDAPETCGGGGEPYQCGCRAKTCADFSTVCGDVDDGCGGTLTCGCDTDFTCRSGRCERSRWKLQAEDPRARHDTGVEDTSDGRTYWRANVPTHDRGTLTSGPATIIPAGSYRVWFRLFLLSRLGDPNEVVAVLRVDQSHNGSHSNVGRRELRRVDFPGEKTWYSFKVDVDWPLAGRYIVPKVDFLDKPYASIRHDWTIVEQR